MGVLKVSSKKRADFTKPRSTNSVVTTENIMKNIYKTLFAGAMMLLSHMLRADEATEQQIRVKYDAKFAELNQRAEAAQKQFQQRADDLSKEAKAPFKLDMTVKWKERDMSLHLPQATMKTKKMSLDVPTTKWGMMSLGFGIKTRGPVFKMERRDFSMDLPEFKWARSNMVMTIPEFTVHEAHFLVPINSAEIKERGAKLESDARGEFARLKREYWNLNAAQQDELVAVATGTTMPTKLKAENASSRLIKSYDNALGRYR